MSVTMYDIRNNDGVFINLYSNIPRLETRGQDVKVIGGIGDDAIYVGEGTEVDATSFMSSGGSDTIFLTGNFSDYEQVVTGNTYKFSRKVGEFTESVMFTLSSDDQVYFADGLVNFTFDTLFDRNTITFRSVTTDDLDSTKVTPSLPVNDISVKNGLETIINITDDKGQNIAAGIQGSRYKVIGSSGDDAIYVGEGTEVDATSFMSSAGSDTIFLTGNFSDYEQVVTRNTYKFSRKVGDFTESVMFTLSTDDKVYFADGFVNFKSDTLFDRNTITFRSVTKDDLDPTQVTPGLEPPISTTALWTNNSEGALVDVSENGLNANELAALSISGTLTNKDDSLAAVAISTIVFKHYGDDRSLDITYSGSMPELASADGSVWTLNDIPALVDGESYSIEVTLSDDNGNIIYSSDNNLYVEIDRTPPSLSNDPFLVAMPEKGRSAFIKGDTINIGLKFNEPLLFSETETSASIIIDEIEFRLDLEMSDATKGDLIFSYTVKADDQVAAADFDIDSLAEDILLTGITDVAGNIPDLSDSTQSVEFNIAIDAVAPMISITAENDITVLKAGASANIIFSLSESADNFVAEDIMVSGGDLSDFKAIDETNSRYTATFTPTENSTTAGVISVAQGKFSDDANNPHTESKLEFTVDTVIPVIIKDGITVNQLPGSQTVFNAGETVSINVKFSEPMLVTNLNIKNKIIIAESEFLLDLEKTNAAEGLLVFSYTVVTGDEISAEDFYINNPYEDIDLNLITDFSGNEPDLSNNATKIELNGSINAVIPSAPTVLLNSDDDSGVMGSDNLTNASALRFTGKGLVGSIVTMYETSENDYGRFEAVVNAYGDWQLTFAADLNDGVHEFEVTQINSSNIESEKATYSVTIDQARPDLSDDITISVNRDNLPLRYRSYFIDGDMLEIIVTFDEPLYAATSATGEIDVNGKTHSLDLDKSELGESRLVFSREIVKGDLPEINGALINPFEDIKLNGITDAAGNDVYISKPSVVHLSYNTRPKMSVLKATINSDTGIKSADNITNDNQVNISSFDDHMSSWAYMIIGDNGTGWVSRSKGDDRYIKLPDGTYDQHSLLLIQLAENGHINSQDLVSNIDTTFTIDTTAPELVLDNLDSLIGNDNVLNLVESGNKFSLSGGSDLEVNSKVIITLNDKTYECETNDDGAWSLEIPALDLASLIEGESYSITINASDNAGNNAKEIMQVISVDTSVLVNQVFVEEIINNLPTITGATGADQLVEISLNDNNTDTIQDATYTVISDAKGKWVLNLATATPNNDVNQPKFSDIKDKLDIKVTVRDDEGSSNVNNQSAMVVSSSYSISNSMVIEGVTGENKIMTFIVIRDGDLSKSGSVKYAVNTALSSAKSDGVEPVDLDYSGANSGELVFSVGESLKEISYTVNGDYWKEINEKIIVELSEANGGVISKSVGIGEINEIDLSMMQSAFSLKDVNSDLVSNAIRVRRSSDNTEKDIGFNRYGELDTEALLQFVNNNAEGSAVVGAKGFVSIWYDQSIRGENGIQNAQHKQPVIVNDGELVTLVSTGEVAVSFNEGMNGVPNSKSWLDKDADGNSLRDNLLVRDTGSMTYKNVAIYETMEYEVFDQSSDSIVLGAVRTMPMYRGSLYWDAGSNSYQDGGRISAYGHSGDLNVKNTIVFEGNYKNIGNGATESKNYTDAAQAVYVNGVNVVHDYILYGGSIGSFKLNKNPKWVLQNNQAKVTEMFIYADNVESTHVEKFLGDSSNDVFTYAAEVALTSIEGQLGFDIIKVHADVDLNTANISLGGIELVDMVNDKVNQFTITDQALDANGNVITVLMDEGDTVLYAGEELTYLDIADAASRQAVILGSAGNDRINLTVANETVYGREGQDTFVYDSWSAADIDTIADFTIKGSDGNSANSDVIDLTNLLDYKDGDDLTNYINLSRDASDNLTIKIDSDGGSEFNTPDQTIILQDIAAVIDHNAYENYIVV
ncbi:MAG: Ig-like domain-containing protein [Gammaproteobacteria bacterium]|nr:Ig-like domain-containing protein [Gammaproteobacteria bacterium]